MSKRLILILALAFVAGITMAAYAEVQNVKVSGDLLMRSVGRYSFDTGVDTAATPVSTHFQEKEDAILSAVRVRIDADLTDNVAATVRLLNERVWGAETSTTTNTDDVDLDLAYVTLKEFLYSPLTLVVGRQELRYGNALIIGDVDTNAIAAGASALPNTLTDLSLRKSFDAAKAILNYDSLVVDLVMAKTEENTTTISDDVRLLGVNAAYTVNSNLLTEAYLWSRDREWGSTGLAAAAGNGERLNTLGARAVYAGIKNLTLGLEGAWQFGDHVTSAVLYPNDARTAGYKSKVNAYAIQFTSNYVLPRLTRYSPVVHANYTRLSGEKDRSLTDNYTGWDAMYEDQAGGTIFNKIIGYSNAQLFNLGGTMKPMDDVTVKLDYYHIRLLNTFNTGAGDIAKVLSGVYLNTNTTVQPLERHLADELDLSLIYDYTEDVQLGLCAGLYIPGQAYDNSNDQAASQVIGSMKVTF